MATDPQLVYIDLRTRVRELVRGWLPAHICAACGKPIASDQVEYDVEGCRGELHLHLGCHAVWQECVRSDCMPASGLGNKPAEP
jgi:hypothetical protein